MPRAVVIVSLRGCASTSSADRGEAIWRCFYLVFEDRKMLTLDRKCGHVSFLGKKISNLEGNENLKTFHSGVGHQCQQGRTFVRGAGFRTRVYFIWICLLKVWV